jgi:nitrogenase molybdenum-iron protein NifN
VSIEKRSKPLSVSPLKVSATMGAALAFLGIHDAIPMLHGAQGCTAYGKVLLIGHFREPVPMQTTAMDRVSTVMGADENVVEGLATVAGKYAPALIGVPTTGLSETQGADMDGTIRMFRRHHPEHAATAIVAVETPDYAKSMETGFAMAVTATIACLVPESPHKGGDPSSARINVLVNASLSPGDLEEIKEIVGAFGLEPVVFPDLSDSLDGHLADANYSPLTTGGTAVADIAGLGTARATLVIGDSLSAAADLLLARTGVPDHRFDHLTGIDAVDRFVDCLSRLTGRPVPARIERQRRQLQDAMLDAHFHLGMARAAVAAEPDLLTAYGDLLVGMGAELCVAVASTNAPVLSRLKSETVKIGDLEDLENLARERGVDIIIGNAHCAAAAKRLSLPLLRAGFPQFDRLGAPAETIVGYRGTRRVLFALANLLIEAEPETIPPYRSIYSQSRIAEEAGRA